MYGISGTCDMVSINHFDKPIHITPSNAIIDHRTLLPCGSLVHSSELRSHDSACPQEPFVTTHDSPQSQLHDSKGLYKPTASKLLIPGYVIGGVPSPRQPRSLSNRQRYSSRSSGRLTGTACRRH
jgi:hypothetical protein